MSTSFLIRTVPILEAIKSRLEEMTWTPTGGGAVLAFGQVIIFDLKDLASALRELLAVEDRVALIVYEGDRWDNEANGQSLTSTLTREVTVIVSDRQLGDRSAATLGSTENPGAYALADLVIESLHGPLTLRLVDAAGAARGRAWMQPLDGQPLLIEGQLRDQLVGRAAKVVRIEVRSGVIQSDIGLNRL